MVARELGSGRLLRIWQDEFGSEPPFATDAGVLFVAYRAAAEVGCFITLGWPAPARIIDPYIEFCRITNGATLPFKRDLLGCLAYYGIPGITAEEKSAGRALAIRGGPYIDAERLELLDYCQTDVDPLAAVLERMLPAIRATPQGVAQAQHRGRCMAALAAVELTGVPIDHELLERLRRYWEPIKLQLIGDVDKDYGVYDGTTFKSGRFLAYAARHGIGWPRLPSGQAALDRDTFKAMAQCYPQLWPLRELRLVLSALKLESLAVGPDHRNRALLQIFGASSGRNTPSNSKFIFGPSVWLRGLIKPAQGRAIAYVDWSSQEVWIAAYLSGDRALLDVLESGDPYLAFAKMAQLAPADATKATHKPVRDRCKTVVLGSNYGMGKQTLALRTGLSRIESADLLRRQALAFPVFDAWADHVVDVAMLRGYAQTKFGWQLRVTEMTKPNTLRNFPVQALAAEMMRLACCLLVERRVQVCCPVHDAFLIEADTDQIGQAVQATQAAMADASRAVLDGLVIPTDVNVVRWPDRYMDRPRGEELWAKVMAILSRLEAENGEIRAV
jgi:hypothetical protein